jgi:guanylate kinase
MTTPPLRKGRIVIFSAPSGAGKTTIVHEVLRRLSCLEFSVSATTRPKREHEINGRDYYFLSEEKFRHYVQKGSFLEWEEVYPGRFYGTFFTEVERIISHGNSAVFDVDVKGGLNIKQHYQGEALAIFIMPPSPEALRERLEKRGTEDQAEIDKRMARVMEELERAPEFDRMVYNEDLETAIQETIQLIRDFLNLPE